MAAQGESIRTMNTGVEDDERWARIAETRKTLARGSTAERVADALRTWVTDGMFKPGTRLSEEGLGSALGVSRNTLREAFRLLSHERLVVHEFGRGVFVRVPSTADVVDLYRMRRILEGSAVRRAAAAPKEAVDRILSAVEEGEQAAAAGRWLDVGTANMHFHQALAALAGSPRVDQIVSQLLAELRLVFHIMAAPREFHAPYLKENRHLVELLEAGDVEGATRALDAYFDTAERQLLDAYDSR